MFNFLKKKEKPTLLTDIQKASEWIIAALNNSGYKVDLTVDSLRELERFFGEHVDDDAHMPKPDGLLAKDTGQRLFALGSLLGNVIVNEYGGKWVTDDNDPQGEINISVSLSNGSVIWPVQRLMKRVKEGPENDVYSYALVAGKDRRLQRIDLSDLVVTPGDE